MSIQTYETSQRIGIQKGEILAHAGIQEVLGIAGEQKRMKRKMGDTVKYRRFLPFGGSTANAKTINQWVVDPNDHLTQEGITPDADTITPQDVSVTINQYSCLYVYTDKANDLHEDDWPQAQKEQTGERIGLVREMVRYGVLKGCSNKFYAGGTSRASVDKTVSKALLRKITRSLTGNGARMVTSVLAASPNYATSPIEAAFLVFCHTDMEHDIRELEGFKHVSEYGSRKPVHEDELGSCDRYRFIVSRHLTPMPSAGAAVGATGLISSDDANIDVYPLIVVAKDAWADLALRGGDSFDPTHIPVGQKTKDDPHGQRGYVGAIFWDAAFIQNDGHMAVAECGATELG